MNKLRHALCVILVATTCALRAADKEEEQESPIGDFMPTNDDLVQYVPKMTVKLSLRAMGGVKATFSGKGSISTVPAGVNPTDQNDAKIPNEDRVYHDGFVAGYNLTKSNPAGNPEPIASDGTVTNNWGYKDSSQVVGEYLQMHNYSVTLDNPGLKRDPGVSLGVDLTAEREMGSLFNGKIKWGLMGGFSVNQISSIRAAYLTGNETVYTDSFQIRPVGTSSGHGTVTLPTPPFNTPGLDENTPFLSNTPDGGRTQDPTTSIPLYTRWRLRGAYVTFRAGPTLYVPITSKFSASMSAGPVLIYVGTSYDVEQQFVPKTGDTIDTVVSDGASGFLPGFYVDANLQYTINDNTGLYAGATYQSATTYKQTIESSDKSSTFQSKVDFGSLEGVKAGFQYKF